MTDEDDVETPRLAVFREISGQSRPKKGQKRDVIDRYEVTRGKVASEGRGIVDWALRTADSQDITEEDALKIIGMGETIEGKLSKNTRVANFPDVMMELFKSQNDVVVADAAKLFVEYEGSGQPLPRDVWFKIYDRMGRKPTINGSEAQLAEALFNKRNMENYDDDFVCTVTKEFIETKDVAQTDVRYQTRSVRDVYVSMLSTERGHIPESCDCDVRKLMMKIPTHNVRIQAMGGADENCYCDMAKNVDFGQDAAFLKFNKICGCELANSIMNTKDNHNRQHIATLDMRELSEKCMNGLTERFIRDRDFRVRANIAGNNLMDEKMRCKVLGELKSDKTQGVRDAVLSNMLPESCGCEVAEHVISNLKDEERNIRIQMRHIPPKCQCDVARIVLEKDRMSVGNILDDIHETGTPECKCELIRYAFDNKKSLYTTRYGSTVSIPEMCRQEVVDRTVDDVEMMRNYNQFIIYGTEETSRDEIIERMLSSRERAVASVKFDRREDENLLNVLFDAASEEKKADVLTRIIKLGEGDVNWERRVDERWQVRQFRDRRERGAAQ